MPQLSVKMQIPDGTQVGVIGSLVGLLDGSLDGSLDGCCEGL